MSDVFHANDLPARLALVQPYDNQRACAHEMLTRFREDLRYVLLRAPLQSGKTGSYQYLIRLMLQLRMIDQAYVLCGSNECELLEQVKQDVKEWHGEGALNRTVHVLFRQHFKKHNMVTRRTLIVNDESHLDCQFNQQLDQFLIRHGLSMAGTTDAMVVNQTYMVSVSATPFAEESVMAHGHSLPKAFVQLQAGERYYGPMDYYRDRLLKGAYSVATAEGKAQFVDEIRSVTDRRKYVMIRLCEGRVASDKVRRDAKERAGQAVSSAKETEVILDTLKEMESSGQVRLLRFTSKVKHQIAITRTEQERVRKMYQLDIPCLEDAPEVPTVILLDGRLRCGKRVPKKHIGMTWDTSVHSNTDVILQGLVGRMCGYRGRSDDPSKDVYYVPMDREDRPILYTSRDLFRTERDAVLPVSDLDRFAMGSDGGDLVPRFATHLIREEVEKVVTNRRGVVVHPCVPIRFFLPDGVAPQLSGMTESELRRVCFDSFVSELEFLVNANNDMTDEQRDEVLRKLSQMDASESHVRRLQGISQLTFYGHVMDAIKNHTAVEHGKISDAPFLTFCVVFEGYEGVTRERSGDQAGTVYACIYTEARGFHSTIPLPTRVPRHNGVTHFIHRNGMAVLPIAPLPEVGREVGVSGGVDREVEVEEKKEADVEALGVYGFTTAIQDSPEALSQQLSHFIEFARPGIGYIGRKITEVKGRDGPRGIRLAVDAYGENLCILRLLISRLEATYHVRIAFKRHQQVVATHANLKYIRWEDA